MKTLTKLLLVLSLLTAFAVAQANTVSLTVTDADSTNWSGASYSLQYQINQTNNGTALTGTLATGGTATISATDGTAQFTICPLAGPLSIVPCYVSVQTLTGSSQSITLAPPAIRITSNEIFNLGHVTAYTDAEVSASIIGLRYYNTTSNLFKTWNGTAWIFDGVQQLGGKVGCTHGSNGTCGVATLASGTVTVSTTAIVALAAAGAGDVVSLTLLSCSSCGSLSVGTVVAATSFVINSTGGSDGSKVFWEIKHIY